MNHATMMLLKCMRHNAHIHYSYVIMDTMVSQIPVVSIVCSTVCSGADQRKYQSSTSLALVRGIHRWPMDSSHKGPVTRKMFPFYAMRSILRDIYIYIPMFHNIASLTRRQSYNCSQCHWNKLNQIQVQVFIFPTEIHNIIYNLYVIRFWREGGERNIAYRAVHLKDMGKFNHDQTTAKYNKERTMCIIREIRCIKSSIITVTS